MKVPPGYAVIFTQVTFSLVPEVLGPVNVVLLIRKQL